MEFGGVPNSDFTSIWQADIPLKVRIFLWLVKQNRVLTKDNLAKRGWTGSQNCVFYNGSETVDHLFLTCPVAAAIWTWIANYNGFVFECSTIQELWDIDACIPMKESKLVELIRGAVLWTIWLERNRLIFKGGTVKTIQGLGVQIRSVASFWCKNQKIDSCSKFNLMLPCNVKDLLGFMALNSMEEAQGTIPMLGVEMDSEDLESNNC
jgi:hypothetical protein